MPDIINSDTVIVGGGITGLYTCYKLNQLKGVNHTISLFESSSRFGGRIETVEMGGFLAEYGPMRFEKMAQPLLMDLMLNLVWRQITSPPTQQQTTLSLFSI